MNHLGIEESQLLMVLEKIDTDVQVSASSGEEYILEAMVAEFGVKNNNGRVYEAKEYLPHLEYLQKQIEKKNLLGHLDHPKDFEVRLTDASHIIESLVYDQDANVVRARIRLLNTESGKKAKSLVDDGVQLSISSRAAGIVENNNKVKIKRIFTYDLVAHPGFEKAQLYRVNESFGISNEQDEIAMFDVTDKYPTLLEEFLNEEFGDSGQNKSNEELESEFATVKKMQAYSVSVKKKFQEVHEELQNLKQNNQSSQESSPEVSEKLSLLEGKIEKLFEHIEAIKLTSEENFKIAQNKFEESEKKFDTVQENFEKIDGALDQTEKNFEKVDTALQIAEGNFNKVDTALQILETNNETVDETISRIQENFEKVDKALIHFDESFKSFDTGFETMEENLKVIDESIASVKELEKTIDDTITYTEKINGNTKTIAEGVAQLNTQVQETFKSQDVEFTNDINEKLNVEKKEETKSVNESHTEIQESVEDLLNIDDFSDENITAALEGANKEKANENLQKWPFLSIVSEDTQNKFLELDETQKEKVSNAIVDQKLIEESEIIKVIEKQTATPEQPKWLALAPENYKNVYESLPAEIQARIAGEAGFRILEDSYQVKNFWETRTYLNESAPLMIKHNNLNESKTQQTPTKLGYSKEYLDNVAKGLQSLRR